jgi:uncharacterized membrane protein
MATTGLAGLQVPRAAVRVISIEQPSVWLTSAWRDFRRAPRLSLLYGSGFVLVGYGLVLALHELGLGSLLPMMLAGFPLVAPIMAVGLYEVSRQLEQGQPPAWASVGRAFRRNWGGLTGMGLVLMLCLAAWMQLALLLFMGFYHAAPPPLDGFVSGLLESVDAIPFLLVGTATGAVIAAFVFAISAVSIPMLLDRDVAVIEAIGTSLAAVWTNWPVMLGWAASIVVLVGIGVITLLLGFAVTLPLVAYATWHAYRALVE